MRRLIEIATERRVTIVMFTVAIGLFGMVSLSPRGDWRMPSDAQVRSWLSAVENYTGEEA